MELRLRPVGRLVLEEERAADLAEAVGRDDEVEVAVAVEVRRPCASALRGGACLRERPHLELQRRICRSQTTPPFSWSEGRYSPRSATIRSCLPSLSRSTISAWAGFARMAICRSPSSGLRGSARNTEPRPISRARISSLPSPSRSRRGRDFDDRQRGVAGRADRVLRELEPAVVVPATSGAAAACAARATRSTG